MTIVIDAAAENARQMYVRWDGWLDARAREIARCRDLGFSAGETAHRLRLLDNEHKSWADLLIGSESMPRDFPLSDAERRAHRAQIAAGRRGL